MTKILLLKMTCVDHVVSVHQALIPDTKTSSIQLQPLTQRKLKFASTTVFRLTKAKKALERRCESSSKTLKEITDQWEKSQLEDRSP